MKKFNRDKSSERSSGRFRDSPKRFNRDDAPRFGSRDAGRYEGNRPERSFEKRLFTVTCAKCGNPAEVPFRPRENKPVYCSSCFRKDSHDETPARGNFGPRPAALSKNELDLINQKLDKILEALDIE